MDGLNSGVITGKCSGCVAYREKVTRLEAANAALAAALQMWDDHDNLPYREFFAKYPWLNADYGYDRQERLMHAFTRAALDALEVK